MACKLTHSCTLLVLSIKLTLCFIGETINIPPETYAVYGLAELNFIEQAWDP